MQEQLVIHGLEALPEGGLVLTYARIPRDVRKNGLMWQHVVQVPAGSDYDDEIEAVTDALQALLEDVLDDESRAEPIDLEDPEEGDEDDD